MIHYTLLPEFEIKRLKREYRIRVFTLLSFFISISILIGIISLIPAYVSSYFQEKDLIKELNLLKNDRESSGINTVIKDLENTQLLINKLKLDDQNVDYYNVISSILLHKTSSININSFQFTSLKNSSSTLDIIIQGKSLTREALLSFKKSLEQDSLFYEIEMPISDLAKGKNSVFAIRLKLKK